jgi:hypothetical protein
MCTFAAAGRLRDADEFPDEVDPDLVRRVRVRSVQPRFEWARVAAALDDTGERELRDAVLAALDRPLPPYPGPAARDDTPDFRGRYAAVLIAAFRHGRPWPPPRSLTAPPGVGLVRVVDTHGGRHRYGVGCVPPGAFAAELGSLPRDRAEGIEPLWVTADGYLRTAALPPPVPASTPRALRWALAPLGWRDAGLAARARLSNAFRRLRVVATRRRGRSVAPVAVVAYVHRNLEPTRLALHSSYHPVTGDQLLATNPWEAVDMGYGPSTVVGYLDALAPVTGSLEAGRPAVPWASRLGQRVRSA